MFTMFNHSYRLRKCFLVYEFDEETGAACINRVCLHKCNAMNRKRFIEQQGHTAEITEAMIEVEP